MREVCNAGNKHLDTSIRQSVVWNKCAEIWILRLLLKLHYYHQKTNYLQCLHQAYYSHYLCLLLEQKRWQKQDQNKLNNLQEFKNGNCKR